MSELREGEALVSDATRRVFASKHECSPKASKLGRELIDALAASQERERQLREALRPFAHEPNGVFSVHDDPASCAHCRAWRALDSTQTGASDE